MLPPSPHLIPKVPPTLPIRPSPPPRLHPRLLLQFIQLAPELILLPPLLLALPLRELLIQPLATAPLLRAERILLDLVPQIEHHVVPGALVRIRPLQMGQQVLIPEFRVGEQVVLLRLRLGEEAVFLGEVVLALGADGAVEDLVPEEVDLGGVALATLLPLRGSFFLLPTSPLIRQAHPGLERARLRVPQFPEQDVPLPLLERHVARPLFLVLALAEQRPVVRVVLRGHESPFRVRHLGEVVFHEFGEVARRLDVVQGSETRGFAGGACGGGGPGIAGVGGDGRAGGGEGGGGAFGAGGDGVADEVVAGGLVQREGRVG